MKISFRPRSIALLTAAVLVSSLALGASPARADKEKNLKYGAIAAGVVGAYFLSKGKVVEGAAAAGGGYYAYKKSKDARREDRRNRRASNDSGEEIFPQAFQSRVRDGARNSNSGLRSSR